ncbi:HAMP domain-containing sensor histidine kinase [Piscinibacter gummiphilus]|uniref:histidine kinase n=1 Tax=Piscinibacter gummiphilus TaxID=946333 RepID=A0ABZ0D1M6_9BURK|nr:HAMP domain-containing sensor histidine kinase [Piscinibacter gummiphilus]WOB08609.1 HAMP domain-containing sensor histidine kinase [Piscinibacter gummiphilus]
MRQMEMWWGRMRQALAARAMPDVEQRLQAAQDELARVRAEAEQVRAESRQLAQQMREKNLFLANLSHELRTPLNSIIGFADLLASDLVPPDSPKRQHFLDHIETSGRHLLQLIDDALELSKLDAGQYEFFPRAVDLTRLIAEVVALLHTRIVRKGLDVDVDVDPGLAQIVVDPVHLKQALLSYLANAVRYTPDGGRIAVRAQAHGPDRFRLEVEDPGAGIAHETQPMVFAEFAQPQGPGAQPAGSTGLSLALTRRLIEAQGGEVGVRSTPGCGSTFFLVLNRVQRAPRPGTP